MDGLVFETNDQAREAIAMAGITVDNVTNKQLKILHKCIDDRMKESGNYEGTYKMNNGASKFMTCQTRQWEERESISFNPDGFIGIAGWSGTPNAIPIYKGIADWLGKVTELKCFTVTSDDCEASVLVITTSASKAKGMAFGIHCLEGVEWIDLRVTRTPEADHLAESMGEKILDGSSEATQRAMWMLSWYEIDNNYECCESCNRYPWDKIPESQLEETEEGPVCAECRADKYISENPHQPFHLKNYLEKGNKNTANGVSHVQRTCGIGYNNAMRTIDLGIVKGVLVADKIHAHQHRIMEGLNKKVTSIMMVPAELLGEKS